MKKKIVSLVLLSLLLTNALFADLIYLKNGDVIKGRLITQDSTKVVVKTQFGKMTYKKEAISRIKYEKRGAEAVVNIYTKKFQYYKGQLVSQTVDTLTIKTRTGVYVLKKEDITHLNWKKKASSRLVVDHDVRFSSFWRSLVLPSWGQFYQGKETKGWVTASVMTVLAGFTLYSFIKYRYYLDQYKSLSYDDKNLRGLADDWRKRFNVFGIITAVGWVWNVCDAVIFSPKKSYRSYQVVGFAPRFDPNGLALEFSGRF